MTCSNAVSSVTVKRPDRTVRRSDRDTCSSPQPQHHARIRRPPQDRIVFAEPREDAVTIRVQQPRRRERPPPAASSPFGSRSAVSTGGNGSSSSSHGIVMTIAVDIARAMYIPSRSRPTCVATGCPPVTRYAPSPTGYLHLGHVVNAIYVWGIARALNGRVLLRIEDHDRIRSRPAFEARCSTTLTGSGSARTQGRAPVIRQSDRHRAYEEALQYLRDTHQVYACACSRKDIGGERYPNTCRTASARGTPRPRVARRHRRRHRSVRRRPAGPAAAVTRGRLRRPAAARP